MLIDFQTVFNQVSSSFQVKSGYKILRQAKNTNRKAQATGFAIPVLGQLPQIFMDVYLLKFQLQSALQLLDIGTECSLRICIGKPCGGVRPLTVGHDDNVFLHGLAQQATTSYSTRNCPSQAYTGNHLFRSKSQRMRRCHNN